MTLPPLWPHQEKFLGWMRRRHSGMLDGWMGTGKTRCAIEHGRAISAKIALVMCPLSVVPGWARQISACDPAGRAVPLNRGSVARRLKLLKAELRAQLQDGQRRWVVVNYDAARRTAFAKFLGTVRWDLLILDEVQRVKSPHGATSKFCARLRPMARCALGMSGTLMSHSPLDVFAEYRAVDPTVFGHSFVAFRSKYCNAPEAPIWMADLSFRPLGEVNPGDEVIGWVRNDRASKRRRMVASRVLAVSRRVAPIVRVTMESGRVIRCTPDHLWLGVNHGSTSGPDQWVTVTARRRGTRRELSHVITPTRGLDAQEQRAADWLAGMYDGEGSRGTIAQSFSHNPETCARLAAAMDQLKIPYAIQRGSSSCDSFRFLGGRQTFVDLANWMRGTLVKDAAFRAAVYGGAYIGRGPKGGGNPLRYGGLNRRPDAVVKVEDDGVGEVVSMQTETGNYVAWGYASKNCVMGGFEGHEVVGYRNLDELRARMSRVTFQVPRDVLDLPPVVHVEEPVELGDEARRAYLEMERDLVARVRTGEVVAANALVKLLRLQQVTGGTVPVDDGQLGAVPTVIDTAKEDRLTDIMEDLPADEPLVVICRFVADLDAAHRAAARAGRTSIELSGRRKDMRDSSRWQDGEGTVLALQIKSGGVGIDLTRASRAVIFSTGFASPGDFDQVLARLHRPGQTRTTVFHHLFAAGTIDEVERKARDRRGDLVASILADLAGERSIPDVTLRRASG